MFQHPAFVRDRFTILGYGALAVFALGIAAVGPAMPLLRDDLGISRTIGGLHFTAGAAGSVIAGLGSPRAMPRMGRRWVVLVGGTGTAAGGLLVALGGHPVITIAGSLVLGTFGNLLLIAVQAALSDHHGPARATVLTEASALISGVFLLPGLVLGLLGLLGLGWRPVFLLPGIVWILLARSILGSLPERGRIRSERAEGATLPGYRAALLALMFAVAVEWSIGGWAAGYLVDVGGLSESAAAAAAVTFYAAMAVGRGIGSRLTRRRTVRELLPGVVVASLVGFAVFWWASAVPVLIAGLALAGLGVANLFPLITSALFAAAPGLADRASAHVSLAGGAAVMIAPLTLGALADRWELRSAFSGVLVLLLALAATIAWWRRVQGAGEDRPPDAHEAI